MKADIVRTSPSMLRNFVRDSKNSKTPNSETPKQPFENSLLVVSFSSVWLRLVSSMLALGLLLFVGKDSTVCIDLDPE